MTSTPCEFANLFSEHFGDEELSFMKDTAALAEVDFDKFKSRCEHLGYPRVRRGKKPFVVEFPEILNAILMWRYPFLLCRNRFSVDVAEVEGSPFAYNELNF